MKYLHNDKIDDLNNQLCSLDTGDLRIFSRIEIYSCKSTNQDRKLKHKLDTKYDQDCYFDVVSPTSPYGVLSEKTSRKTLFYLISTLNAVYPDYNFDDVKPEQFQKVPLLEFVINRVNNTLLMQYNQKSLGHHIWTTIDTAITTSECDIYVYTPENDGLDDDEGNLWSFYYFFYNKHEKRMLFFTCRAVSLLAPIQPEESSTVLFEDEETKGLSYSQYTMQQMDL